MNDFEEFDKSFSRKGGSKQSYKQPTPQNNIYQQLLTPIKDDELDILDKVKNNMELYLNQLESDPLTKKHDALKLLEIDRLNDRIQDKLQNKKQDSIDDLLKDMNLLNKYNPVIN